MCWLIIKIKNEEIISLKIMTEYVSHDMGVDMRKPVLGVSEQQRLRPA